MQDVHAVGGGEFGQWDHAATLVSASAQASASVGVGPNSQARASYCEAAARFARLSAGRPILFDLVVFNRGHAG